MNHLLPDGSEKMDTDSLGTHEDDKDPPQKWMRYNILPVNNTSYTNTSKKERIDEEAVAVDGNQDNQDNIVEKDDSSVETVQMQSSSGLSQTRFGIVFSPVYLETRPDKN